jgi:hypothetical protein
MDDYCALCLALRNQRSDHTSLENTSLLESEHFCVLPSVGPFVPGHVMVVSKEHYRNLATMGMPRIDEYRNIAQELSHIPFVKLDSRNFVFAMWRHNVEREMPNSLAHWSLAVSALS